MDFQAFRGKNPAGFFLLATLFQCPTVVTKAESRFCPRSFRPVDFFVVSGESQITIENEP
jgi:hypothetical protein